VLLEGSRLFGMAVLKVEFELPKDLLEALGIPESELGRQAREWVLLELFQEGKISSGKAAEVMGLSKAQFLDLLSQRNLPYLDAEGSWEAFDAVLAKVPDAEPDPWDRWASPDMKIGNDR
jgi:predicted HTH domain antitoxin